MVITEMLYMLVCKDSQIHLLTDSYKKAKRISLF